MIVFWNVTALKLLATWEISEGSTTSISRVEYLGQPSPIGSLAELGFFYPSLYMSPFALLGLFFNLKDEVNKCLQNPGKYLVDYTVLHPRRRKSSLSFTIGITWLGNNLAR
jgi:hypothetical protein